jgi:hypothetical protein
VQDDGRGGTVGRPPQLCAQQAQLRAQVALGGGLATEVDQRSQPTVLVAQGLHILFGVGGHGQA